MDFVFTSGEQEFYAQKGFTNEPTRCASCGTEALVPFVPRGDKPVYCSDCFQQQRQSSSRSSSRW
jgi:CxxC-x17-CxxC domain-containing protein